MRWEFFFIVMAAIDCPEPVEGKYLFFRHPEECNDEGSRQYMLAPVP